MTIVVGDCDPADGLPSGMQRPSGTLSQQLVSAHAHLMEMAMDEANDRGIPHDGSWLYKTWSEVEETAEMTTIYRLRGRWERQI